MTSQEFDNTGFCKGMMVGYDNLEFWIRSVQFKERLLGLLPSFLSLEDASNAGADEIEWVRCENCKLLNKDQ